MSDLPSHLNYDTVANILEPICEEMVSEITRIVAHPIGAQYDDLGYTELFLRTEFLLGLKQRGLPADFPDPQFLRSAIPDFMDGWENYHVSAGHDPPPEQHRRSIERAFQELLSASTG